MTVNIFNDSLTAKISKKGAELVSLKSNGIEYIWQGDPTYWKWHAPILFPFIGKLKHNQYSYKDKSYQMPKHGFARDCQFDLIEHTNEYAIFSLESNEETLKLYPFMFHLTVKYEIWGEGLRVHYNIQNLGEEEMIFALGSRPAFNLPLKEEHKFEDYYFSFLPSKCRINMPLEEQLVNWEQRTLGQTNTYLGINRELFSNHSLIYETRGFNAFTIETEDCPHNVTVAYKNIPYVSLWSPYPEKAPFVCIEPWCGLVDTTDSTGRLEDKVGMNRLSAKEQFKTQYSIIVH